MGFPSIEELIYRIPAILIGLTIHEYSHARMAYFLGDPTAKNQGRLTLNPIKHLDPLGTILLFIAGFGWAKPVPVNSFHIQGNRRLGMILVSLAGPLSNVVTAFIALLAFHVLYAMKVGPQYVYLALDAIVFMNVILAAFNLIPLPPLDGSGIVEGLLPGKQRFYYQQIERYAPLILLLLIVTGFISTIFLPIARVIVTIIDFLSSGIVNLIF